MDYEKEYKAALERARAGKSLDEVFPELMDSDDEKIRKELLEVIKHCYEDGGYALCTNDYKKYSVYLEKQKDEVQKQFNLGIQAGREEVMYEMEKEQKPTEWSEQDERNLYNTIEAIKYSFDVSEGSSGLLLITWLKSRLSPQPHWKPSKKQMWALEWKINNTPVGAWQRKELESIYKNIKKL